MKSTVVAVLGTFLIAAFSGCLDGDGDVQPNDAAGQSDQAAGNTTAGGIGTGVPNEAPVIVVKILVNGTEIALANESYVVPASENVTFDASGSSDAEGAALTFAWDFGDGNTSKEAVAVYAFAAVGNYTVSLHVSDEANGTTSQALPVVVASSGPAPGTFLSDEKKTFSGTVTLAVQDPVGLIACGTSTNGVATLHEFKWDIAATEADGTPVKIAKFVLKKPTQGATGVDLDYYLMDPKGKEVGRSAHFEALDGAEPGFTKEGEWLPGAYKIVVKGCAAVNATFSGEITATRVAA